MTPEQRKQIKQLASQCFGLPISKVSVRQGRGTACHWKYVTLLARRPPQATAWAQRGAFEAEIRKKSLASTYWPDDGFSAPGDGLCISVDWVSP